MPKAGVRCLVLRGLRAWLVGTMVEIAWVWARSFSFRSRSPLNLWIPGCVVASDASVHSGPA